MRCARRCITPALRALNWPPAGCVLARCVHAVFLVAHAGAAPTHPDLLAHLRANRQLLAAGRGAEREVVHAAAVEAWASGRPRRAAAVS
jgi:hypothetical protein